MTVYLTADKVDDYLKEYIKRLKLAGCNEDEFDKRIISHLKNEVVIKYSKAWQDKIMNEIFHIITEVPGGYWQIQEFMQKPHVEFEHYTQKGRKSYEKGNVSLNMAKKELKSTNYKLYSHFKKYNTTQGIDKQGKLFNECDLEVTGTLVIPEKTERLIKSNVSK